MALSRRAARVTAVTAGLAAAILTGPALPALAVSNDILISEFRVRGPMGGNDEFVELLNKSSASVDISGYKLQGCASGTPGNVSDRAVVPTGTTLAAGERYLFTNNGSAGYSGTVGFDQNYGTGFTDFSSTNFSGIRVLRADATVADQVGAQPNSPCREGTGLVTPTTNGDVSFERTGTGGTTDTDNNASDFAQRSPSDPQNRASDDNGGGDPGPQPVIPEVPLAAILPLAALGLLGGAVVLRRHSSPVA